MNSLFELIIGTIVLFYPACIFYVTLEKNILSSSAAREVGELKTVFYFCTNPVFYNNKPLWCYTIFHHKWCCISMFFFFQSLSINVGEHIVVSLKLFSCEAYFDPVIYAVDDTCKEISSFFQIIRKQLSGIRLLLKRIRLHGIVSELPSREIGLWFLIGPWSRQAESQFHSIFSKFIHNFN